jgi:CBS domain-containing protein
MTVEHILAAKGRNVVTIEPERTLGEAARLLDEKRIGAVVVSDADHAVLGIFSERDIVKAVARGGPTALDESVSRYMTTKVITCTGRSAISELMELMTAQKFRHVPIIEDGRLNGIVSIGDIVKHRLAEIQAEHRALREYIATA